MCIISRKGCGIFFPNVLVPKGLRAHLLPFVKKGSKAPFPLSSSFLSPFSLMTGIGVWPFPLINVAFLHVYESLPLVYSKME